MKRLGVVLSMALLGLAIAVPVVDAAPSTPFTGSWTSIDPTDDSTQHLYIMGGTNVQILYVDEFGTVCELIGAPTTVATAVLAGRVTGNELDAWFRQGSCGPSRFIDASDFFVWSFTYDQNTDTIYGSPNDGPTTWYRD